MLQRKLHEAILEMTCKTSREPSIIVMHPETWGGIVKETSYPGGDISASYSDLKYRGIAVLRSMDVEKDTFFVR